MPGLPGKLGDCMCQMHASCCAIVSNLSASVTGNPLLINDSLLCMLGAYPVWQGC